MSTEPGKTDGEKVRLSPPWVTLQRTLAFTIGQSSQVLVKQLDGGDPNYSITVIALNGETAQALANVVKSGFSYGNIQVSVTFTDTEGCKYDPTQRTPSLGDLRAAILGNPLVYDVEINKIDCLPTVIQFWNDDISNPYGFTSKLASEGFTEIVVSPVSCFTIGKKVGNN